MNGGDRYLLGNDNKYYIVRGKLRLPEMFNSS